MKMAAEPIIEWFINELLPTVVKNGHFSDSEESQILEKCEFGAIEKYVSSFASAPCFAKITLRTPSGTSVRDVLIKFQHQNPLVREKMRGVQMYFNEVTLYNEVYPSFVDFLKTCGQDPDFIDEVIPKCYFASLGNGDEAKAVLILKDLRSCGFRLSDSRIDFDLEHCLMAVEKLARFHSISFAMKFRDWEPLEKLKTSFADVMFEDIPYCREYCDDFLRSVSNRGIDYLLAQKSSDVPKEYLEKLRKILKPTFETLQTLMNPTEPLSVIHHGDFNRNNILCRYSDSGELIDSVLIDFQRVSYASPSLDLGFLIYMNTTMELREKHFDQIFESYYKSLVKHIASILKEEEESISDRIPMKAFVEDFGRVALYHYVIVSFFLPVMMTPQSEDFELDMECKTPAEMGEKNAKLGGEEVSKRLADILLDFYRRKFYT